MSSLYSISIAVLLNIVTVTGDILKKGGEHAEAKGVPASEYVGARIHEDMLPLQAQVFIVRMMAFRAVERLTGTAPAGEVGDAKAERTLAELLAVVDDTARVLRAVTPESVDGRELARVPCASGPATYETSAAEYVLGFLVPTAFFHVNMIYAILRGKGVPLGKSDYIAPFMKNFELKSTS